MARAPVAFWAGACDFKYLFAWSWIDQIRLQKG